MATDCVFCRIVAGQAPATVLFNWEDYDAIGIRPLNPVTEGHVLVIPKHHEADALENPWRTAQVMEAAARWAEGPCNIITSVGPEATQTVFHLHIHIVPRHRGDGLQLPWGSNEEHMRQYDYNAGLFYDGGGQHEERD